MALRVEISAHVLVHGTEDAAKIISALEGVLGITEECFEAEQTQGHYGNPITVLRAAVVRRQARDVLERLRAGLSEEETEGLISSIGERTVDSRLHVRLDKQGLARGRIAVGGRDTIQLKIHVPVYNKRETARIFAEVLSGRGNVG